MPTLSTASTVTAEDLFRFPADGFRYELVNGSLRMMSPAGGRHGRIAVQIAWLLKNHVHADQVGVVFAAETGFRISSDPDTVLAPDVAYVERSRYEALDETTSYLPIAPDLVIEVLSPFVNQPSDRFAAVESKALAWLDASSKLVLLVDPDSEVVHAYRSRKQIEIFQAHETIDCSDAVAGWTLVVADVFKLY
ncbi:MAG: Uma2 family endonuclease [Rubripirellula sp.]